MTAPERKLNEKLATKSPEKNHLAQIGLVLGIVSLVVPAMWCLAFAVSGLSISFMAVFKFDEGKANNLWSMIFGFLFSIAGIIVGLSFQGTLSDLTTPGMPTDMPMYPY